MKFCWWKVAALAFSAFLSISAGALADPEDIGNAKPIKISSAIKRGVQETLESRLRDPDSAKIRNLKAFKNDKGVIFVCGEVNAKNAYGGYVGYQKFRSNMMDIAGNIMPLQALIIDDDTVFYEFFPYCM